MRVAVRALLICFVTVSVALVSRFVTVSFADRHTGADAAPVLAGEAVILPLMVAVAGATLWAGWRGSSRVFGLVCAIWFLACLVSVGLVRATQGAVMAALPLTGTPVEMTGPAAILATLGAVAAFFLLTAREHLPPRLHWAPLNTTFAVLFAGLYLTASGLVAMGPAEGVAERAGVTVLILLPLLANLALVRWRRVE